MSDVSNKWRFGCGKQFETTIPTKYSCKLITVECGSTAYDGGVNQCDECASIHSVVTPFEEEGDMEWFERQCDKDEDW